MPRFYGRVKTYYTRPKHHANSSNKKFSPFGFIVEFGEVGTLDKSNVVDIDVHFREPAFNLSSNFPVKATTGEWMEYEREQNEKGQWSVKDNTMVGLHGTPMQCQEGLLIFKRWKDIGREEMRRRGTRMIDNYLGHGDRGHHHGRNDSRDCGRNHSSSSRYNGRYQNRSQRQEPPSFTEEDFPSMDRSNGNRSHSPSHVHSRSPSPPRSRDRSRSRTRDQDDEEYGNEEEE